MDKPNWAFITSGATFEALATTLVYFEDPNAKLFGRRGKDGGQDARSGDGTRVFQAKHHEDRSAAAAIRDAKTEAAKIAKHRKPDDARYDQWKGVTHWVLVTNATFNPTDQERWDKEVVPLFANQSLSADYWECATIESLLVKYPEINRAFFRGETRVFLTLPEVRERLPQEEPFLLRDSLTEFRGREDEVKQFFSFLSAETVFLVVQGQGGIGKTRLLVEAGEEIASDGEWQVFWANIASMAATSTWFEAINPERKTLLLIDEPENEQLLRILLEQLGGRVGRATKWKVAVAVRSPKDPVLRFFSSPRVHKRVQDLPIEVLSPESADEMCFDLISSGPLASNPEAWRRDAAHKLSNIFSRYPVWLTLAVHVLEKHGDLSKVPQTAKALAETYLDEIIGLQHQVPREQVLDLLRCVALIGTVNRKDDATIKLIGKMSKCGDETKVRELLASLVDRRALVQRGAEKRLIELKPDVLRDHILLTWLAVYVGYDIKPSSDAKSLISGVSESVLKGDISTLGRTILISLARTELLLRLSERPVPLLKPFFTAILAGLERATASQRVVIAEVLQDIAAYSPLDTVEISRSLRSSDVVNEKVEGLLGDREIGKDDVILELAWPLFHAAMGAQSTEECGKVLEELCAVAEVEAEIGSHRPQGLPNDGKRARQLVGRTIGGGPHFSADYELAASTLSSRLLDEISAVPATPAKADVIKALLEPALSLERQQTWSQDFTIHFSRFIILPGHPAWKTRETILNRLKDILADINVPPPSHTLLWTLYAEAHRTVNYIVKELKNDEQRKQMRKILLDDLVWAYPVLDGRRENLSELKAARDLWNWHYQFDDDPEFEEISNKLETLYTSNSLSNEFEPLMRHGEQEQRDIAIVAKASELATGTMTDSIKEFLDRAVLYFLGNDQNFNQLFEVALKLGGHAVTSQTVRDFVKTSLAEAETTQRTNFAKDIAVSWITVLRKSDTLAAQALIYELFNICGSDEQKIHLIYGLYWGRRHDYAQITSSEHDYLRSLAPLFMSNKYGPAYIQIIGWTLDYKWSEYKTLIEQTLNGIDNEQLVVAINNLVDAVYFAVRNRGSLATLPQDLSYWLVDQLLRAPDLNDLGAHLEWSVEDILKRIGRAPLSWLPRALRKRREMVALDASKKTRAISHHPPLSHFVMPVTTAQKSDPDVIRDIKALVDMLLDKSLVGYYMPDILQDVDPDGVLVPDEIVSRLSQAMNREEVWCFARVAGTYEIGSVVWRTIAKPIIIRAVLSASEEERLTLFSFLLPSGMKSWSGDPREVPQLFIEAVKSAKLLLKSESDVTFKPFWEWNLSIAEAELKAQEEEVKERRGE